MSLRGLTSVTLDNPARQKESAQMDFDNLPEHVVRDILSDPFYAIELAPIYGEPHKPLIDVDTWIAANVREINERGAEAWLRDLLHILRGDGHHHSSE
jgi:hypothetical protein